MDAPIGSVEEMTHAQAISVLEKLILFTEGHDRELAIELRNRLSLPMSEVLAKVKGETHKAKAARIGISRQTYYEWRNGINRPTPKQAKKLALITRISAERIMGRKR